MESSGTSYLLQKMLLRGTTTYNKSQLHEKIEAMGGRYTTEAGRESSFVNMQVFKQDVGTAVKLLGDMLCNSTL